MAGVWVLSSALLAEDCICSSVFWCALIQLTIVTPVRHLSALEFITLLVKQTNKKKQMKELFAHYSCLEFVLLVP